MTQSPSLEEALRNLLHLYEHGRPMSGSKERTVAAARAALSAHAARPIPMALHCPSCGLQHIDRGEWATRPHKTHLCEGCGHEWRPFEVATVGVDAARPADDVAEVVERLRAAGCHYGLPIERDCADAADIIARLSVEVERLKGLISENGTPRFNEACRRAEAAEQRADALAAENEKLRKALDEFGRHRLDCISTFLPQRPCNCGYDAALSPAPDTRECECFGDSGLHASTHQPVDSDRLHCDLCGCPVPNGSCDVLSAINAPDTQESKP